MRKGNFIKLLSLLLFTVLVFSNALAATKSKDEVVTDSVLVENLPLMSEAEFSKLSMVEKAFLSMPNEYYLLLTKEKRTLLLSEYKLDSAVAVKNLFGGYTQMKCVDSVANFISVRDTRQSQLDFKVVQKNDSTFYMVLVFTACAPVCDSYMNFFDSKWNLLRKSLLEPITISNFLDIEKIKADGLTEAIVTERFGAAFIKMEFEKGTDTLLVSLQSEKFMDKENYLRLKKYLIKDTLVYTWNKDAFVLKQ